MRAEGQAFIDRIDAALALVRKFLDWDRALRRLDELNARVEDPKLWDNPKGAEAVMRERRRLEAAVNTVHQISQEMADAVEFVELGEAEGDDEIVSEGLTSLAALAARADADKVQALLAGEADGNDAYLEVHAGAGGTESQDWAEMLQRMYYRWAEQRGYKVEMVDYQAGDQAGIKSATMQVKGENAYGNLKVEGGVHRLVRISPYDSSARRHTSFASVWVYLDVDIVVDLGIDPDGCKAGVAPGRAVVGADPHQPVDTALGLEVAIGILTLDQQRRRFDAGLLARVVIDQLDLHPVAFAPAGVHPLQHFGPVLAFGAAGPGVDLDVAVVGVGLPRQQRRDLVAFGPRGKIAKALDALENQPFVAFRFGHRNELGGIGQFALDRLGRVDRLVEPAPLAHHLLRRFGIIPQRPFLDLGVQFLEPPMRAVPIEEPAEQRGRGIDLVDMVLRFGAHHRLQLNTVGCLSNTA